MRFARDSIKSFINCRHLVLSDMSCFDAFPLVRYWKFKSSVRCLHMAFNLQLSGNKYQRNFYGFIGTMVLLFIIQDAIMKHGGGIDQTLKRLLHRSVDLNIALKHLLRIDEWRLIMMCKKSAYAYFLVYNLEIKQTSHNRLFSNEIDNLISVRI